MILHDLGRVRNLETLTSTAIQSWRRQWACEDHRRSQTDLIGPTMLVEDEADTHQTEVVILAEAVLHLHLCEAVLREAVDHRLAVIEAEAARVCLHQA